MGSLGQEPDGEEQEDNKLVRAKHTAAGEEIHSPGSEARALMGSAQGLSRGARKETAGPNKAVG